MANPEHVAILKQGVEVWNLWRKDSGRGRLLFDASPRLYADLSNADLHGGDYNDAYFDRIDMTYANLSSAQLMEAKFRDSYLGGVDFKNANLRSADFRIATLGGVAPQRPGVVGTYKDVEPATLEGADLWQADLSQTYLAGVSLKNTTLTFTDFSSARLAFNDFTGARLNGAVFAYNDLSTAKGLDAVHHEGPSTIGIDTLYLSNSNIPESFLIGCGVPESLITYARSLTAQPVQFYSCFISYTGKNEDFARRLHSRMREAELRVWFAPEDIQGGDKIYDQIDRAIQVHDRLLLVLSEHSMQSKWVETEIRRARKVELREGRRKLFPIRLVSYEALQEWICIDSTSGEDLAEEVRSYFIPDFSNWKNHDDLERAFARLLADLKASA
jgi:uncharacterized protein YjbI with pentapeptide repeats